MKLSTVSALIAASFLVACSQSRDTDQPTPRPAPVVPKSTSTTPAATTSEGAGDKAFEPTFIQAAGPDGVCTEKFLSVYPGLSLRVSKSVEDMDAAILAMQKKMDAQETSSAEHGQMVKAFGTLRSTMTEFKQTFGPQFSCTSNKVVLSGDAHFAKFKEQRARLGKMIGEHLMGKEI